MSFTKDIKEQISKTENICNFCDIAELSAMIKICTTYQLGEVTISTENENVADRFVYLFARVFSKKIEFENKNGILKYRPDLAFFIEEIAQRLMLFDGKSEELAKDECCKVAYIRGAFLGGGSVSNPNSRYHLEFDTKHEGYANQLCEVLNEVGISAKITYRKGRYIVYIKGYEVIADLLGVMGDINAAMQLYNASIEKNIRNNVNRRANCEVANIDKITKTAQIQIKAINKIKLLGHFDNLPDTLQEMANIRLENPESSLTELGGLTNPTIGKSGVNHRLKRLLEIAEKL